MLHVYLLNFMFCNKNLSRLITNISYLHLIIPRPPRIVVPSFDDDIRLQRWFVTNISHNCPRLSYTNKQIEHKSMQSFILHNKWIFFPVDINDLSSKLFNRFYNE